MNVDSTSTTSGALVVDWWCWNWKKSVKIGEDLIT